MFSTPLNPFTLFSPSENALKVNFNEAQMKKKYRSHNIYVTARVKPSNILHFNVKDGWEPLCNFLERPIPNFAFPKVNTDGGTDGYMNSFWARSKFMKRCQREAIVNISISLVVLILLSLLAVYFFSV